MSENVLPNARQMINMGVHHGNGGCFIEKYRCDNGNHLYCGQELGSA